MFRLAAAFKRSGLPGGWVAYTFMSAAFLAMAASIATSVATISN